MALKPIIAGQFYNSSSGGGSPGGAAGTLQFNNAGAFGGVSGWSSNGTTTITGAAGSILSLDAGAVGAPSLNFGTADTGIYNGGNPSNIGFTFSGVLGVSMAVNNVWIRADASLLQFGAAADLLLARDAANTLALRNGANAQTFHVQSTYTDGSNYARLSIKAADTSGNYSIAQEEAGTGLIGYLVIGNASGELYLDGSNHTIRGGNLTMDDARNLVFNTGTGTKLGTATSQKLSLWNKAPDVQPTNAIAAAAFVANTSLIADDTATFGGYTIGQIAAALIRIGALA